ncbi:MmgE/PrpD family protein (plasmid) [Pseudorhodobacter turbinis]|uniref:MmgE/PrpD family protein n=1 Tax=Pseudorhodobacter turbinis TaxID=2500533 RepID=A0A4P8EKJ9_9RHOB|nr:MmgE/PrpD family protein [Pseudorhodobacter turbinis]QCO57750.1 MmgE/PrpD family protein [Pseudorhodobacter turbinis]
MTLARKLADFAAGPIHPTAAMRDFVRLSLFDWTTVGIAGGDEPVAQAARKMALGSAAMETGATMFRGGRAAPATAALVNGATSHALDYDDTHFGHIGHPSVAVTPAALALAEREGVDGAALLEALAVGLETACRVGAWLGRVHYEAGFHQTGTSGAFGAMAAAGRILGLDAEQMAQGFRLTATRAAGLKSQFGTMGKPLNAGFAAEVGVTSALLARAGAQSAQNAIEGAQGFGPTHAGAADESVFDGLGQAWLFPNISYKFHACCHGLHAMLEAVRTLRDGPLHENRPNELQAITIRTHPRWFAVCNKPAPATGLEAKFSYRLTAAMMLAGVDTAALGTYTDEVCTRPDLVALRDRIEVIADDNLADSASEVTITTAGQGDVTARYDILTENDPAVLEGRLRDKAGSLLGAEGAADLWETVAGLDQQDGLANLIARIGA